MASASAVSGVREYAVLGTLEVRRAGAPVDLGSPKQRAVLASLILARGAVVSVDRLIDTVWQADAPAAATTSLQAYISNLRRALRSGGTGPSPIERVGTGYRLVIGDDRVDVAEFIRLAAAARAARDEGRWSQARTDSAAALALWRGELAGDELGDAAWFVAEAAALAETRTAAADVHISALLATGDVGGALSEIAALRVRDRLHERTVWLQMVALYRSGRITEALETYTDHARTLDTELGLDPGTELTALQGAILRHDPVIAAWPRPPHWTGSTEVEAPASATVPHSSATVAETDTGARFVGRTDEIRRLRAVVSSGSADPRWILLTGPPGIGKTALAEESVRLAVAAYGPDTTVVWVRCPDTEGIPAWWPLRQACRALGADPAQVLSVPDGSDADTARFAVYDRVHTMLEHAAASAPLIFVVDDLQWADPMSLGLLNYLMSMLRGSRIIVIATVRDGEGGPEVHRFRAAANRSGATVIPVPRLSRDEVAELVRTVAREEMAPADVDLLARRTGGNPLFVTEFARLTHESRRDEQIPEAVRSILDRRLTSLDPAVLEVIGYAAAIGEDVDVPLLVAVTGRDPDDVADCLDEAVDEHILVTRHDRTDVPIPAAGTRFAHALLREGALGMIRPLRRARIHLRIAEVLGEIGGSDSRAVRAAHLVDALAVADPREVVAACRAAADDATAAWDSEKAAYWLGVALRIYESAPRISQDVAERDDLLMGLLTAQTRAGQVQQALAIVETRLDEAIAADAPDTLGRLAGILLRAGGSWPWVGPNVDNERLYAALESALDAVAGHGPATARVLGALAVGYCYHHDASVPAGLLDRADEVAAGLGDDAVEVDVLIARLITYSGVAAYARSSIDLADRIRLVRARNDIDKHGIGSPATDVDDIIVDTVLTMSTMMLGDVAGTERLVRRGIAGSERYRLPILRAQLRWMETSLAVWHGDFGVAMEHFRTAVKVHQMTELYVAGSDTVAMLGLATERQLLDAVIRDNNLATEGQSTLDWARSMAGAFSDNQMTVLLAAGVAMIARADGDRELAERMITIWLADDRPMVWTSLCQAVLLGHVVADLGLTRYARHFIDYLTPYSTCVGALGQIGQVGTAGLALAKLHYLAGDDAAGDAALRDATETATRGAGLPSLLRCRLLAASRTTPSPDRDRVFDDIESRAADLGLIDVAAEARAMRQR